MLLSFAALLLSGAAENVAADELLWAKSAGGMDSDGGRAVTVDADGNGLVSGFFRGSATFGSGEPNETTLDAAGGDDIFVAKYTPDGMLLWARQAGGTGDFGASGRGIAADEDGNSLVTGDFWGTATFGSGEPNETVLESAGSDDIFLAKYTPDGELLWATKAGGNIYDGGAGVAVDTDGNGLVTGYFFETATFGAGEPNETTLVAVGSSYSLFVAKYDRDGGLLWATQAGGAGSVRGFGIAVDTSANSVVTGDFSGTVTFGAGESNETTLVPAGSYDVFVAKYSVDGSLIWARSDGGPTYDLGYGIAADAAGNSMVTGFIGSDATFGAGEPNETTLEDAGYQDGFTAKYDPDGILLWATQVDAEDNSDAEGHGIATDPAGNGVVTGEFSGIATFGAGEPNETILQAIGYRDIFVAKHDANNGDLLWAAQAGGADEVGPSGDSGNAIAVDNLGSSLVTGRFLGTAAFGAGTPNETTLVSAGAEDIFVAKWEAPRDQADVFLVDLRAPGVLTLREDREITRKIAVFGDGDTLAQDATVTLSAPAGAGIEVEIEPEALTRIVEPGMPLMRFAFEADIECEQEGTFEVQWTAIIDAAQNAYPLNDAQEAVTSVRCRAWKTIDKRLDWQGDRRHFRLLHRSREESFFPPWGHEDWQFPPHGGNVD
ncbi:MAG: hypothetical protein U9Q81_04430 [Pseudomonadota bacterium]|nr:hypothetical protein [Pseudomonadota bacterium]